MEVGELEGNDIKVIITENNHVHVGDVDVIKASDIGQFLRLKRMINAVGPVLFGSQHVQYYTPR